MLDFISWVSFSKAFFLTVLQKNNAVLYFDIVVHNFCYVYFGYYTIKRVVCDL